MFAEAKGGLIKESKTTETLVNPFPKMSLQNKALAKMKGQKYIVLIFLDYLDLEH